MTYCSTQDAVDAGATGTAIPGFILEAEESVNRYCGDYFEPTALSNVQAVIGNRGVCILPYRVQTISSVIPIGGTTPFATTTYIVHSSGTPGDWDGLEFAIQGYDALIVGAEPWHGGFGALFRPGIRVTVAGTFGWSAVPGKVRRATALITASLTQPVTINAPSMAGVQSNSVEGASVTYFAGVNDISRPTTGNLDADRLLQEFRRTSPMIRVGCDPWDWTGCADHHP